MPMLRKRAEYHIMSQTADVKMEPLKWPIAPDGYIPNSVIRSWGVKEKVLHPSECWDDIICYGVHPEHTTHDKEDLSSRVFWFDEDSEEDEEKKTDGAKRRRKEYVYETKIKEEEEADVKTKAEKWKEKDNEKYLRREVERKKKSEMEGNKSVDEKKEEKMDTTEFLKQSYNIQTKTATSDHEEKMRHHTAFGSAKTTDLLSTLDHKIGPKALTELGDDITPPLLSVSSKQRTSSYIREELPEPPVDLPADTFTTNGDLRITDYIPPTEPQEWTCHPQMTRSASPHELQLQAHLGPTERSPVRGKMFLLSTDKYDNIMEQATLPLDQKVLKLYKKYKNNIKNSSHRGKLYTTAEQSPSTLKATPCTSQTNTDRLRPNTDPSSSPALTSMLSSIQAQPHRIIHSKHPGHLLDSNYTEQVPRSVHLIRDQYEHTLMAGWRKSLYTLISLQGFRSQRAARLAATEHPVTPSNARQHAAPIPSVWPDQVSVHQRVVQKIQMKDTLELTSTCFHHVIPVPAQHSFFTLDPCGTTQYGRLQFDWMRGHEEGKLLKVCVAKTKDTAHKVVDTNRALLNTPA